MRRLAASFLTLLAAATATGCGRESATGPGSSDAAPRLDAVSATDLEGTVADSIKAVPTVIVRNESGQPVRGIRVTFGLLYSASNYGDYVRNRIVKTDSRGVASPGKWMLGTMAGLHGVEASILGAHVSDPAGGAGRAVAFNAVARAAAPSTISIEMVRDTAGLPGDELDAPTFAVMDRFGNHAVGIPVVFSVASGGGSLGKTRDEMSLSGASPVTWTLGPSPGRNSFVASVAGLEPVTFNARAVDAGRATWYDLPPSSIPSIESASIALCENGIFELVFVEDTDVVPGPWRQREFGTYVVSGATILLTYASGFTEQGRLADDRLAFVHAMQDWIGVRPSEWDFVRREGQR